MRIAQAMAALVLSILSPSASASAMPMAQAPSVDCGTEIARLGPKPADRATVIAAMERVEACYARDASASGSRMRDGLAVTTSILAIGAVLAIAGLLFWNSKRSRDVGVPLAVLAVALLVVSTTLPDGGSARSAAMRDKIERERLRWAIRMARSNQITDDGRAIGEALAATDEFIQRLSPSGTN